MSMYFADDKSITPEQLARIQFFSVRKDGKDDDPAQDWIPSKKCNEIYADEIANDDFYKVEFSDDAWICPDAPTIEFYNNPFLFDTGSNFVMTINDCATAVTVETE